MLTGHANYLNLLSPVFAHPNITQRAWEWRNAVFQDEGPGGAQGLDGLDTQDQELLFGKIMYSPALAIETR